MLGFARLKLVWHPLLGRGTGRGKNVGKIYFSPLKTI
jgi:hypothetical protein